MKHRLRISESWRNVAVLNNKVLSMRRIIGLLITGMFGVCAVSAAIYFWPSTMDRFSNQVRIYELYCHSWDVMKSQCTTHMWAAGNVRLYSVRPDAQSVIETLPDIPDYPIERLNNCAVVSRTEWDCATPFDPDGPHVVLRGGVFHDYSFFEPNLRYGSRWEWWIAKWTVKEKAREIQITLPRQGT
jgi:hypothetical protein